ncbi:MAG: DUF3010 family protein [Thiotrichales bacterium]|nr:DUF3010 family protein [Thiotrichales bacterium]
MRVLGIELVGSEAVVALVEWQNGFFYLPECRARRVSCRNPDVNDDLRYFQKSLSKLVEDYKIDRIVIRERMKKGKFAGGADGFKLEAVLQLLDNCEVQLMHSATQSAIFKRFPLSIAFNETGLKKFQQGAFEMAYAVLSDPKGQVEAARQQEIERRKEGRQERRQNAADADDAWD